MFQVLAILGAFLLNAICRFVSSGPCVPLRHSYLPPLNVARPEHVTALRMGTALFVRTVIACARLGKLLARVSLRLLP